ncbi:MAG: GLUG motif-containing protein, partial [Dethiobacteria bacterium]
DGKITGCTCTCAVTGTGQHLVGGVVGSAGAGSEISNSSSSGDVTGKGKVGGIAGYTDGDITICINTGNVNGNSGYIGGVAGEAGNNSAISNSYNSGDVQGSGQGGIGGIVGHAGSGTVVHHNLNKGAVAGNNPKGSVIGEGIDPDNAWNNYYYDYGDAPGGASGGDIVVNDGAVSIGGDPDWEKVWEDLNKDNPGEDGNPIWNQDMDDEGVPKPGGDGGGTGPGGAFKIQRSVIKEGKHFGTTILEDTGAAVVTVTADSVFTAAFSLKYDQDSSPGEHRLRLKNKISGEPLEFPAGTSVIMLADGSYYYLNLAGLTAGITEITLKNLIKMGSATQPAGAAKCYHPAPVAKDAEKDFLFIFDFSGAAVSDQAETLSYKVELTNSAGEYGGAVPLVNITGKNNYGLSVSGAGSGDSTFTFSFTGPGPVVSGYDYKIDGKRLAFEFYLEKAGASGRIPLPVGTKINQSGDSVSFVSAALPYAFLPESFTALNPLSLVINLDQAGCAVPLAAGNYRLAATAYAFADSLDFINPRGGTVLAESGPQEISLVAPVAYAIRASASARAFDLPDDPAEKIAVTFTVQARGSENVKATLQRKYGQTYVDVAGEKNKFVGPDQGLGNFMGSGSSATLSLPVGTAKGTYRFLFMLYDENGVQEKARTVKNIIVK